MYKCTDSWLNLGNGEATLFFEATGVDRNILENEYMAAGKYEQAKLYNMKQHKTYKGMELQITFPTNALNKNCKLKKGFTADYVSLSAGPISSIDEIEEVDDLAIANITLDFEKVKYLINRYANLLKEC